MLITVIAWSCLVLSVASFVVFLILALRSRVSAVQGAGAAEQQAGLSDIAKVAEALAKLAESLTKAGPGIAALVASIFFMLLAATSAGLDKVGK